MTPRPGTAGACCNHVRLIEQNFRRQMSLRDGLEDAQDRQVDFALIERPIARCRFIRQQLEGHSRMAPRKTTDDRRDKSLSEEDGASDSHFPYARIGEALNLFNSLLQLVEGDDPVIKKGAGIDRWFNTSLATVQQTDPKRRFHIGNRLRYSGLRQRELRGCFSHASAPHDGQQYV